VRRDNKENLKDSAPCINCLNTMINLNIKRIVFSSTDDTFISCSPCDLTLEHLSAGEKFLRNNGYKQAQQAILRASG
tara:strand:+ start:2576 stop:2806 length:231 start_codon:yes stop_codon:yes gene_type:complete